MRAPGVLSLIAVLAACGPGIPPPTDQPKVHFTPDAGGLAVSPGGLRVDFGRARQGVITALSRSLGPARPLPLMGCPPKIAQRLIWGDLELSFTAEAFVGWRQGSASAGRSCG